MAFAHITLPTRDAQALARFFEATLGWRPIERPGNIVVGSAWLEIAPGQEVHLLELSDFTPSTFEGEFGRHLAVTYPRAEFQGLQDRLREQGAEIIPPQRSSPRERFFFQAPDGYIFEIVDG
ncbi:MAG: hypothetical protein NVSMB9_27100 [Isosphaeraceae bacterium]